MNLLDIMKTGWNAFWSLGNIKLLPLGNGSSISVLDFLLFMGVSEILIWVFHALAGKKEE